MMSNNDGGADGDDGENNDDDDDEEEEELPQHRPQTATTHVSTKVMCNSKFMELSGTLLSSVLLLHYFNRTNTRQSKKREEGRQAPEPQLEPRGTSKS